MGQDKHFVMAPKAVAAKKNMQPVGAQAGGAAPAQKMQRRRVILTGIVVSHLPLVACESEITILNGVCVPGTVSVTEVRPSADPPLPAQS